MKRILIPFLFSIAIFSGCGEETTGTGSAEEVKREIHGVYNKAVSEWNNQNMRGYMKMFWQSDSLSVASGARAVYGWQRALETSMEEDPEGEFMGQAFTEEFRINPVDGSNAWSFTRFRIEDQGQVMKGASTDIWEKKTEGWRIVHSHISYGR